MKRKVVLLMCVLAMASLSFGDVLIGNFEDDGMDVPWWVNSDPTNDVAVTFGATGATLDSTAAQITSINGGWGSQAIEFDLFGTDAQAALASTGTVKLDALPVAGWEDPANGGWPLGWGGIELFVNCDGYWNYQSAVVGIDIWNPSTQTLEWQLEAAAMAAVAAAGGYCNIGLQISTGDNPYDEIAMEYQYPQVGTAYIDNVRIVPEPATLSLLGLGALAMLKRRKA